MEALNVADLIKSRQKVIDDKKFNHDEEVQFAMDVQNEKIIKALRDDSNFLNMAQNTVQTFLKRDWLEEFDNKICINSDNVDIAHFEKPEYEADELFYIADLGEFNGNIEFEGAKRYAELVDEEQRDHEGKIVSAFERWMNGAFKTKIAESVKGLEIVGLMITKFEAEDLSSLSSSKHDQEKIHFNFNLSFVFKLPDFDGLVKVHNIVGVWNEDTGMRAIINFENWKTRSQSHYKHSTVQHTQDWPGSTMTHQEINFETLHNRIK